MTDKPLNDKRQHFVREYCTNGHNASKAYKTAYPDCKGGWERLGHRLMINDDVKRAIVVKEDEIGLEDVNSREYIDNKFKSLLAECLVKHDRVNATRVLENMAKNRGYYAADNEQQGEQKALTSEQQAQYDDYLAYRRRMLLKPAKGA